MSAEQLHQALIDAGLNVKPYGDWASRGSTWATTKPSGVMHHHTAAPVPFPVHRLIGARLKANINTKPDGTVWLLAYGACNYSSGPGSSVVLRKNVNLGIPPEANAKERGLSDDFNGNNWYWNFENDHLGDGSPIPDVQLDAIVEATRVVLDHFGLTAGQVISHAEHTARKNDPYWNGTNRAIEEIRNRLGDDMTPEAAEFWQAVYDDLQTNLDPKTGPSWARYTVEHLRNHPSGGGGLTEQDVKAIINDAQIVAD